MELELPDSWLLLKHTNGFAFIWWAKAVSIPFTSSKREFSAFIPFFIVMPLHKTSPARPNVLAHSANVLHMKNTWIYFSIASYIQRAVIQRHYSNSNSLTMNYYKFLEKEMRKYCIIGFAVYSFCSYQFTLDCVYWHIPLVEVY